MGLRLSCGWQTLTRSQEETETHNAGFVTEFLGNWEKIEALNECNDIPKEVLEANPDIETLDMLLAIVKLTTD